MLVSIRAKFRNIRDAELAYKEVRSRVFLDKVDLITNRNIKKHMETEGDNNFMWGTIRFALMGAIVGLIFGLAFTLVFNVNGQEISSFMGSAVFVFVGAIAGIVFSTAIFFISKEKSASISENDLKSDEAMLIVTLKDKALGRLRKILTRNNVEKIYRT